MMTEVKDGSAKPKENRIRAYERETFPPNPYEVQGLKIVEETSSERYISVIYEGWQARYPDIPYDYRFAYPDAVRLGERGRIVPRIKPFEEVTFQDMVTWGVLEKGELILANDRSLSRIYDYH